MVSNPELQQTTNEAPQERVVISLPEDKSRVEQLNEKLREYQDRQTESGKRIESAYSAPEVKASYKNISEDARYKSFVLKELLDNKNVDSNALLEKMKKAEGENFNQKYFDNAISVIGGYTIPDYRGAGRVKYGTGLKEISPEAQTEKKERAPKENRKIIAGFNKETKKITEERKRIDRQIKQREKAKKTNLALGQAGFNNEEIDRDLEELRGQKAKIEAELEERNSVLLVPEINKEIERINGEIAALKTARNRNNKPGDPSRRIYNKDISKDIKESEKKIKPLLKEKESRKAEQIERYKQEKETAKQRAVMAEATAAKNKERIEKEKSAAAEILSNKGALERLTPEQRAEAYEKLTREKLEEKREEAALEVLKGIGYKKYKIKDVEPRLLAKEQKRIEDEERAKAIEACWKRLPEKLAQKFLQKGGMASGEFISYLGQKAKRLGVSMPEFSRLVSRGYMPDKAKVRSWGMWFRGPAIEIPTAGGKGALTYEKKEDFNNETKQTAGLILQEAKRRADEIIEQGRQVLTNARLISEKKLIAKAVAKYKKGNR